MSYGGAGPAAGVFDPSCSTDGRAGGAVGSSACSAVDTLANEGVNLAMRLSVMSSHHHGVRGPLSVVAQSKRENRG